MAASAGMVVPMQTSSEFVICNYGAKESRVQAHVPKEVLLLFRLIRDVNEDCQTDDSSFCADIPSVYDAKHVPIHFTEQELSLFFELAAKEQLTNQHLEASAVTPNLIMRYLILVNFLDNEIYLNTLCQFAAHLIKNGLFLLN